MADNNKYDLVVIGGGPAGYVGAIRAAQLGMKVAVFEAEHVGGCCLNVGCIPTKALFSSADVVRKIQEARQFGVDAELKGIDYASVITRKDSIVQRLVGGVGMLLKKNRIEVINDYGKVAGQGLVKAQTTGEIYEADNILIATGSSNALPPIPGIGGDRIVDSTQLLDMKTLPGSIAIIGGGVIGCEFAGILSSFGTEVTIIEMLPCLLANMDEELSSGVEKLFKKKGIKLLLGSAVKALYDDGDQKCVEYEKNGETGSVTCDCVLISTGRRPNTDSLFEKDIDVEMNRGFVRVDSAMQTSVPGIYAAGDVTGEGMLAHTAYAGAETAVEQMAGMDSRLNLEAVPKVVFVDTEIASVGMTEKEAKDSGREILIGRFYMIGNGKALAMGETAGFVKIVADKEDHTILGLHMMGPEASELITVGVQLVSSKIKLEEVESAIYPHPSVSEAIKEAALGALGRAIHA